MTRPFRVHLYRMRRRTKGRWYYYEDIHTAELGAQNAADIDGEQMTIERCRTLPLSPTRFAVAVLNDDGWCAEHQIIRYVKPKPQQRVA